MEETRTGRFIFATRARALGAAFAVVIAGAAPPLLAQGAPLGGTVDVSLLAGAASPGRTFPVAIVLDLSKETGTCGGFMTQPATLGAYILGVTYDSSAFQYVGVTSCGVPQFTNPVCADHGTFVNCNDVNAGNTSAPQGFICVARLNFKSLVAGSFHLSVLNTPTPRSLATNLIIGCGGPVTIPSPTIAVHGITIHSAPVPELGPTPIPE